MYNTKNSGLTLIELMIGLTLSVLILSSAEIIYVALEKCFFSQTALTQIEENSRMAMQLLTEGIHRAGLIGCARLQKDSIIQSYGPYSLTKENKIRPYISSELKAGTDSFIIQGMQNKTANLLDDMNELTTLTVTQEPSFKEGDIILIADCQKGELFEVNSVIKEKDSQKIIIKGALHQLYRHDAEVSLFEKNAYFIAKTDRVDDQGKLIYALYIKDIHNQKQEMVEGITAMQIAYTVLADQEIQEKKADAILDWSNVMGLSITLEFASLNNPHLQKKESLYVALRS